MNSSCFLFNSLYFTDAVSNSSFTVFKSSPVLVEYQDVVQYRQNFLSFVLQSPYTNNAGKKIFKFILSAAYLISFYYYILAFLRGVSRFYFGLIERPRNVPKKIINRFQSGFDGRMIDGREERRIAGKKIHHIADNPKRRNKIQAGRHFPQFNILAVDFILINGGH